MKRRIITLLLALCLLLPSHAQASNASMANFVRVKTYTGQFSDLTETSPFYSNVKTLYEYGLAGGKANGTYGLKDNLTVGQAVIFASRIYSLYHNGAPEQGADAFRAGGQPAAVPHLLFLQSEGVLGTELDGKLGTVATRAQMAHVLANLLPQDVLTPINNAVVTEGYALRLFITDVNEYTPYYQDILSLYRSGICAGTDSRGSFLPDQPITRGAVAAMLTRLVSPTLRITITWDLAAAYSAAGTTYGDLVEPGTYIAAPATDAEIDSCIRYMLSKNSNELSLRYPSLTSDKARQIMNRALQTVKRYCEQSYNQVACTYDYSGTLLLRFSAAPEGDLAVYRATTLARAIAVHDQLWADGFITNRMTDLEKAQVYFTWVCSNCVYDYTADDASISHIPYSLFQNGTAVCDGYTGAYNLLLQLEGISCYALSNQEHIWTVAALDGAEYHIDTTWGDTGGIIDYRYFAMTPQQSYQYHAW